MQKHNSTSYISGRTELYYSYQNGCLSDVSRKAVSGASTRWQRYHLQFPALQDSLYGPLPNSHGLKLRGLPNDLSYQKGNSLFCQTCVACNLSWPCMCCMLYWLFIDLSQNIYRYTNIYMCNISKHLSNLQYSRPLCWVSWEAICQNQDHKRQNYLALYLKKEAHHGDSGLPLHFCRAGRLFQ